MQIPVTIEKKLFTIQTIKNFHGETVPFEVETYQKDFESSEKAGFFDLSAWGVVEIVGSDAANFLQRMSTINIKNLNAGSSCSGAFLTGRGTVVAMGTLISLDSEKFLFVVSPLQTEKILNHLEMFHFQEKLEIKDKTSEIAVLGLWKSKVESSIATWTEPRESRLSYALMERSGFGETCLRLREKKITFLGMHLFHYFRVQMGLPWMGWELGETDLILEAGLEDFVARNKGCYPGQEVVERIFTYGQVNRKLLKVNLEGIKLPEEQSEALEIKDELGTSAGVLMSILQEPEQLNRGIGLAYIRKNFWGKDENFFTDSGLKVNWTPIKDKAKND
ncbi:MAG: YgfZ/GcvT domain-containing protein [Pseudomonadota bacterium]